MNRPIGWYLDPENARRHRFWDGERWISEEEAHDIDPRPSESRHLTTRGIPAQRRPPG